MSTDDGRPFVVLSAAVSLDGYLDDASETRLLLSDDADFDRVDELRATADAILVGANTIRRDDPRLVCSPRRSAERVAEGRTPNPVKVTVTAGGTLDATARFFTVGESLRLVYTTDVALEPVRARLAGVEGAVEVVAAGDPLDPGAVLDDLGVRGVATLMVEGGSTVNTLFLTAGLFDELWVAYAPFFVGDPAAPRFVRGGEFANGPADRLRLAEVRAVGDMAVLRYRRREVTAR